MNWFTKRRSLIALIAELDRLKARTVRLEDRYYAAIDREAAANRELIRIQKEDAAIIRELNGRMEYLLNRYRKLEEENLRAGKVLQYQVEILGTPAAGESELQGVVSMQAIVNEMKGNDTVYVIQGAKVNAEA